MMSEKAEVTGIDLEPEALSYARTHYPGPFYRLADVRASQGSYDWVVSLETLEHMHDPQRALAAFRSSGRLICSTPNEEYFPFRPESYKGDRFPHIRHYRPKEFDALLEESGWKVEERFCQKDKRGPVVPGTAGPFIVYVCT